MVHAPNRNARMRWRFLVPSKPARLEGSDGLLKLREKSQFLPAEADRCDGESSCIDAMLRSTPPPRAS